MAKVIKLIKKDLTKTVLETAAKELNKILLALNPDNDPIIIGKDTTVGKLNDEIAGIAVDVLTTEDKLSGKTKAVIVAMGITIPEPETGGHVDGVTAEQLETAIADINKVLELDPAIPNDDLDQMKTDIIEVANDADGIKPGDDLTVETRDLITALQAEFDTPGPGAEGDPEPEPGASDGDPDPDPDADKAAKAAAKKEAADKKKADAAAKKKAAGMSSKEHIELTATELNKRLKLKPPIAVGNNVKINKLVSAVLKAADNLTDKDNIGKASLTCIEALRTNAGSSTNSPKETKLSRFELAVMGIQNGKKTVDDITDYADAAYAKGGGANKHETRWAVRITIKVLVQAGAVTFEDGVINNNM